MLVNSVCHYNIFDALQESADEATQSPFSFTCHNYLPVYVNK
jgi:hypothetical protein